MKKEFKFTIIAICVICSLNSCNDPHDPDFKLEGNVEKYFPDYCVSLSVSYNISGNKYIHMEASPFFYFVPQDWDIMVQKVDYFIDDEYIGTATESPFTIEYSSDDWKTGAHTVRGALTLTGQNIETFVLNTQKTINNSTSSTRAIDVWFDYNYATTGENFYISVNINYDRSAPGTKVNSFTAEWDGISMGEKTNAPYELSRLVTEAPETTHPVSATLYYTQDNLRLSYSYSMSAYKIPGPDSVEQMFHLKSSYNDFKNGEMLEAIARLYVGEDVKSFYELEVSLDENPIASTKDFPYNLSYLLENIEIGEHALNYKWIRYDENGKPTNSVSSYQIITITE